MNRRAFLGLLGVGVAATSVKASAKPKTPDSLIYWTDLGIKRCPKDRTRILYAPHGPLDFICLPAPIMEFMVTNFGATFHCVNGCMYHLQGHPGFQETWVLRAVADVATAHY